MAMRTDCKHYESRTYAGGETVRKCRIDLAPEAPWRCPDQCPGYTRRLVDAGWAYGSLAPAMGATPAGVEPPAGDDVAAVLDAAEDIVNSAGQEIVDEMARRQAKAAKRKRLRRKRP